LIEFELVGPLNLSEISEPYTIILTLILITTRNAITPSDIGAAA